MGGIVAIQYKMASFPRIPQETGECPQKIPQSLGQKKTSIPWDRGVYRD
jgi:hypothetical protein